MPHFYDVLLTVLKEDNRFFAQDGTLLRNAVYEAAMQMDAALIRLLLSNAETKQHFFTDVEGTLVFDKVGFGWVVNNRQFLPDSYTRFKNKIGLADMEGQLISASNDVSLVFPYKDCVLEGGQSTEDQKRGEVFYNALLAPDEVDRLLYPKCLCSAFRYDIDGEHVAASIDANENLIIKGNNLLALASLKRTHEGKIKCIYIDPPYYFIDNKSGDTFGYNSNFKLSTWLVFMKNRLLIARDLLSADGSIWISVGKDGQHYLKVLADDIFGADCFVADISWQKTYSPRNDADGISNEVESILVYGKKPKWKPIKLPRTEKMKKKYKNPDNDVKSWRPDNPCASDAVTHQGMVYAIQHPFTGEMLYPTQGAHWRYKQQDMLSIMRGWCNYELRDLHDDEKRANVCGVTPDAIREGVMGIVLADDLATARKQAEKVLARGCWPMYYFTSGGQGGIAKKTYDNDENGRVVTNYWSFKDAGHTDEAKKEIMTIFDDKAFSTPKPEKLMMQILQVATQEGDIVLDYHLGSGTTCSVAHQMKRHYIGIEQMDYIKSLCVARLKYNILGGETNISKNVNWQGGGSFVYCELMQLNAAYADKVQSATTKEELERLRQEIEATGFISCKVTMNQIDDHAEDFMALSVDDQKRFLMELLDKNMLYVNLCDMDDAEFGVSDEDKAFTKSFYGRA